MFLCVIPSLEKSKKELSNLGRISLAVIRLATSVGLGGGEIMGNWKELVDLNVSASEVPSFLFVDEYAAIAVDGFAEVFTQGRSLGMSGTLGSQDWAGIKKANEAEAQQIVANTKLKFIMTTDDPNDTKQLVKSLAESEDEEMRSQGYSLGLANYYDNQSAQAVKASRIDSKDLSGQVEGEWHLFFKNRIIRGFGFFAGGIPDDENAPLFVHHLLMVEKPKYTTLSAQFGAIKETLDRWSRLVADADDTRNLPFMLDYADMEGCKPLGDVFEAARMCNAVNASEGLPGLANKLVFSTDNRRELACAAVYSWVEERPQATEIIACRTEAERRAAIKKLAGPAPERVSDAPEAAVKHGAATNKDTVVAPEAASNMAQESPRVDDGVSSSSSAPADDDDPLAAMERQMSSDTASVSVQTSAMVTEDVSEAKMEGAGTVVGDGVAPETESLPGTMDRTQMAASAFSGLSQFVEEAVACSEKPLEDIVKASSQKTSEAEKTTEAQEAVQVVKNHVLHVLTDPPYPSPPTPEPMETSKFRSMAERWIKQVKDQ